jgi:hypothetical protein
MGRWATCATPSIVAGSRNVKLENGGFIINSFTESECDLDDGSATNVMTIRSYPSMDGKCTRDGITRDPMSYYMISLKEDPTTGTLATIHCFGRQR